jgi:hypothetical protein
MSGGYKVTMDDLKNMSQVFEREATTLTGLSDKCLAVPDGGDGTIDKSLSTAVQTATALINQLAGAVHSHGEKLGAAEQQYRNAEDKSNELVKQLNSLVNGNS